MASSMVESTTGNSQADGCMGSNTIFDVQGLRFAMHEDRCQSSVRVATEEPGSVLSRSQVELITKVEEEDNKNFGKEERVAVTSIRQQ